MLADCWFIAFVQLWCQLHCMCRVSTIWGKESTHETQNGAHHFLSIWHCASLNLKHSIACLRWERLTLLKVFTLQWGHIMAYQKPNSPTRTWSVKEEKGDGLSWWHPSHFSGSSWRRVFLYELQCESFLQYKSKRLCAACYEWASQITQPQKICMWLPRQTRKHSLVATTLKVT